MDDKVKKIKLDFCEMNFDNCLHSINNSTNNESLENSYSKAVNAIEMRDKYNKEKNK